MTGRRGALALLAAAALSSATVLSPALASAAKPRTSLTSIWNNFMCTACHEPLPVAQSPEAYNERDYLEGLIKQGLTVSQIERDMVAQYGSAVLAKPPASGFNLTVYILPPAVVVLGLAMLAYVLPRWRERARLAAAARAPAQRPPLNPAETERLDEELSRFGG